MLFYIVIKINQATSPNLYRSYYPHGSRELVSPGIFFVRFYFFLSVYGSFGPFLIVSVWVIPIFVSFCQFMSVSFSFCRFSIRFRPFLSIQCFLYPVSFTAARPNIFSAPLPFTMVADGRAGRQLQESSYYFCWEQQQGVTLCGKIPGWNTILRVARKVKLLLENIMNILPLQCKTDSPLSNLTITWLEKNKNYNFYLWHLCSLEWGTFLHHCRDFYGGMTNKVSPLSTDPAPLYSMYSKLQNVNIGFLDSRLGPTLSCLVAEKR